MSKNLYLVMGLPCSGKSLWLKNNINNKNVVNLDEIDCEYNLKTVQYLLDISNNVNVYINSTSITRKDREKLLDKLILDKVNIYILYINSTIERCIERNNNFKDSKISNDEIINLYHKLELPSYNEKYKYKSIIEVKNF